MMPAFAVRLDDITRKLFCKRGALILLKRQNLQRGPDMRHNIIISVAPKTAISCKPTTDFIAFGCIHGAYHEIYAHTFLIPTSFFCPAAFRPE